MSDELKASVLNKINLRLDACLVSSEELIPDLTNRKQFYKDIKEVIIRAPDLKGYTAYSFSDSCRHAKTYWDFCLLVEKEIEEFYE